MGWRFPLKYANVVAYLTAPQSGRPPRLTAFELQEFFGSVQGEYRERSPLISSDPLWIQSIINAAKRAQTELGPLSDEIVEEWKILRLLAEFRELLRSYELFGLAVGDYNSDQQLRSFVDFAAYSSRHHAIFLAPDLEGSSSNFDVLDPFPAIALISERPENWPGIIFWSRTGATTFAKLQDAYDLYNQLLQAFDNRQAWRRVDDILQSYQSKRCKKLLHLSDLHFGNKDAIEKEAYLSGHLDHC